MPEAQSTSAAVGTNAISAAINELQRRIRTGEDLGSMIIDFDTLPPREPDPEWNAWEQVVLVRAFEVD